jgi:type VI secretion system secreted protein VgrG
MKNTSITKNKTLNVCGLSIGLALAVIFVRHDATAAQAPVPLGYAATFGVLAATTVTSTGATTIDGDLGVSPGNAVSGAPTVTGTTHLGDPIAAQAQADLLIAYNNAAGRTLDAVLVAGNLGGQTFAPGLYKSSASLEISSGDLTLDAGGDPNAVWIFQMATTLVTFVGRQVILSGGAQAGNVFWQVGSSATIGGSSIFNGTILAYTSITMNTSGTVFEGRLLAMHGAVALDSNAITVPTPVTLVSAVVVTGPYTDAVGQSVNLETKTITVPASGSMQYYRIRSGTALTITGITVSGGNVVITYN